MTTANDPAIGLSDDGDLVAGALASAGEVDTYTLNLVAGTTYHFVFERTSGTFWPRISGHGDMPDSQHIGDFGLWAFDDAGTLEAYYLATQSQVLVIQVQGYEVPDPPIPGHGPPPSPLDPYDFPEPIGIDVPAQEGTYTVSAKAMPDDQSGLISAARPLSVGGSALEGTIDFARDVDLFKVPVVKGQAYVFEVTSQAGALDPAVSNMLVQEGRATGNTKSFSPDGVTARTYFVAGFTADYYIGVASDLSTSGEYTVSGAPVNAVLASGNDDSLEGSAGDDIIYGRNGSNVMHGNGGDDFLDGAYGLDFAVYDGLLQDYQVKRIGTEDFAVTDLSGTEGQDILWRVERLKFEDAKVLLDLTGTAGSAVQVLGAVFGSAVANDPVYVGMALALTDQFSYLSDAELSRVAIDYRFGPGAAAEVVIQQVLTNILGVAPGSEVMELALGLLEEHSLPEVVAIGASSSYNLASIGYDAMREHGIVYL